VSRSKPVGNVLLSGKPPDQARDNHRKIGASSLHRPFTGRFTPTREEAEDQKGPSKDGCFGVGVVVA